MGLRYTAYIDSPREAAVVAPGYLHTHVHTVPEAPSRLSRRQRRRNLHTYGCAHCRTHLSSSMLIMSKNYRGKTGDAYLMDRVVNVIEGKRETRQMMTGEYVVCDILCHWCKHTVGWKYLHSEMKDQKFKEGKFILELKTICLCN